MGLCDDAMKQACSCTQKRRKGSLRRDGQVGQDGEQEHASRGRASRMESMEDGNADTTQLQAGLIIYSAEGHGVCVVWSLKNSWP